jgi:CheY-like chemotaxis protein
MTASEDGLAGLDLAQDEPPDPVLRDLMRPRLDGWVVLGQPKGDALPVASTWPRDGSHAARRRGAA